MEFADVRISAQTPIVARTAARKAKPETTDQPLDTPPKCLLWGFRGCLACDELDGIGNPFAIRAATAYVVLKLKPQLRCEAQTLRVHLPHSGEWELMLKRIEAGHWTDPSLLVSVYVWKAWPLENSWRNLQLCCCLSCRIRMGGAASGTPNALCEASSRSWVISGCRCKQRP